MFGYNKLGIPFSGFVFLVQELSVKNIILENNHIEYIDVKITDIANITHNKRLDSEEDNNIKNSPIKPLVRGNPLLARIKIKKKKENIGIFSEIFLKYIKSLVDVLSYNIPIEIKSAADTNPWLIIR